MPPFDDDIVWSDPVDSDIEAAAAAIQSGRWTDIFPSSIDQIEWVDDAWTGDQADHAKLLKFWREEKSASTSGALTSDRIDPITLRTILPHIMLLDVEAKGFDARYRVYGTGIANNAGKDWTGSLVSEMNRSTKTGLALFYRACYRAVFRQARPLYTHHQSPPWLRVKAWKRLIIPVHDKTG